MKPHKIYALWYYNAVKSFYPPFITDIIWNYADKKFSSIFERSGLVKVEPMFMFLFIKPLTEFQLCSALLNTLAEKAD